MAVVAANIAEQLSKLGRFGNRCEMPTAWRWQAAGVLVDEILARLQRSHVYSVLVDVLNGLAHTLGCFQIAAILRTMQAPDNFRGQNHLNWFVSHPWEDVDFQMSDDFLGVVLRPFPVFLGTGVPGAG
ncbi:hypothetical protein D7I39_08935 [Allopusillimonas ginsengisoli]|nr:hypothetical protein D7I39_08935 [Allopusillimonas ginsengisoli]